MASKHTRGFDMLSVPSLFGFDYLLLFGLTAIDATFDLGRASSRARDIFFDFEEVSAPALVYVWLGYCLFLLGYSLPVGRNIAMTIHKRLAFLRRRSSFVGQRQFFIYMMLVSSFTFPLMVSHVQEFGGGRITGTEEFDLTSPYDMAGDISFIIYSLCVWRFMLMRRDGADKVSRGYMLFVSACLFALELIFGIWIESRTHLVRVLLVAVLAYHYGYRRIRGRFVLGGAVVLIAVVMPLMALQRGQTEGSPALDSLPTVGAWGWDSIMGHYSSLEGFTVTFERLDRAPQPDPLWMIFGGLIPRALWPDKPFSTWGDKFSLWVSGDPTGFFLATLPGELLLHFGYIGALIALMGLGMLWRTAFTFFIGSEKVPVGLGFIYIVLLSQAVPQIEVGFVGQYNALLRMTVISFLMFLIVSTSRSTGTGTPATRPHLSMRPVIGPFDQSGKG